MRPPAASSDPVMLDPAFASDGAAVCADFDRWHGWTGLNQSQNISYVDNSIFKGSACATEHPTGTGLFVLDSWERGQQVTLTPNPTCWGEAPRSTA